MRKKVWFWRGIWLACFLFLWFFFSFFAASFLDPDFGWQLKTGEWIWENRAVPWQDLFSYSMSDYPWRSHSWLSQVVLFLGYMRFGYVGLAVFFSFLAVLSLMLWVPPKKLKYGLGPLLLAGLVLMDYTAVRPKMISFLMAACLFFLLKKSFENRKFLLGLPFLFGLWVNLHGGFIIGLGVVFLALLTDLFWLLGKPGGFFQTKIWRRLVKNTPRLLKEKKITRPPQKEVQSHCRWLFLSLGFSLVFTLFNPYFFSAYEIIFKEIFFGQRAHWRITEWLPYGRFNLGMMAYTAGFGALAILFKKQLNIFEKITILFFLVYGLFSQRFLPYFFIFTLPFFINLFKKAHLSLKTQKKFLAFWRRRVRWISLFLFLVFSGYLFPFWQKNFLTEASYYPQEAVKFLNQMPLEGNLFSVYNWGGYLIWRRPGEKVYIDGRMAIWEKNGFRVFEEELKIHQGRLDYRPVFEKHQVVAVLLPAVPRPRKTWETLVGDLMALFFPPPDPPPLPLFIRLARDGWKRVYADEAAQVWQKPKRM